MNLRFRTLAVKMAIMLLVFASAQETQAGIIPWTYNAIFGPVGSTFGARRAYYGGFAPYNVGYAGTYYGNYGACSSCSPCDGGCNTCGYSVGYAPLYGNAFYGNFGCGNCGFCNNCSQGCGAGCPNGNCSSYTPAAGTTLTPAETQETPTTTFKSSKPTVNEEAIENNSGDGNKTYDETDGGFEKPTRANEPAPEKANDAPAFNPFGSSSNESLKVPSTPMIPVEKRQPAPTELEGSGELRLPTLRMEPAPVAFDQTSLTWNRDIVISRSQRIAHYSIPVVARHLPMPAGNSPWLPPLPTPVQVAGK